VISAIGEGVADFKVGDEVFGVCEAGQEAAYAEKIAVKAAVAPPAYCPSVKCPNATSSLSAACVSGP
jgi:NADPH:quinone reductase-like Zn-dependent oxidoreductase